MVKNSIKKLKKSKLLEVKEAVTEETPAVAKQEQKPNLKKELVAENAYISGILNIIHFPKRADSDDDDHGVVMDKGRKKVLSRKGGAANVQELRDRLKAKLESLQGNKPVNGEAKKKKKLSKEEKKAKLKEEKRLQAKIAKMAANNSSLANGNAKAKPVYNAEGKMVFSKFDFTAANAIASTQKKQKDPKLALQNIQKQKEKLKKLEEKGDSEGVKNLEEGSAWTKALDKAEGVKVKDDVNLLKKSIKKQEQRKKSSAKKWEARKETEQKRKDGKIQKREDNIKKRKNDKKSNKMKKLTKKGRVPGFR